MAPWTVARQAPLSMEFSRQEYWSGLPFPPPGDLPHPGIEPASLVSPAFAARFFTISTITDLTGFHHKWKKKCDYVWQLDTVWCHFIVHTLNHYNACNDYVICQLYIYIERERETYICQLKVKFKIHHSF